MSDIHRQLEMFGYEALCRKAEEAGNRQLLRDIEAAHRVMTEPGDEDIAFLHTGLCQTALPHARPASDDTIWQRSAGRFHFIVNPGAIVDPGTGVPRRVGVPYGPRARLVMLWLQTEGVKSRTVTLGRSMSAWMRSLGLSVTGGRNGTIASIKEQSLRISRCVFTLQWSQDEGEGQGQETIIQDQPIVDGLRLWEAGSEWRKTVCLTERFHEHLKQHAMPLDNRAIASLSGNSLCLDLYATLAYRLPQLERTVQLRWAKLHQQFGSQAEDSSYLSRRIKKALPMVLNVYPDADVEITRHGLVLKPSRPAVARTSVQVRRYLTKVDAPPGSGYSAPAEPVAIRRDHGTGMRALGELLPRASRTEG